MFRTAALGRFIPEGSRIHKPLDLEAWVYTYGRKNLKTGKVQLLAIAYAGKANNPAWHIQFGSEMARFDHIQLWLMVSVNVKLASKLKKERREFKHSLKVNDILRYSWDHDQTNNEFYKVIDVKGKSVIVVRLAQMQVEAHSSMSCPVQPIPGETIGKPMTKARASRQLHNDGS